MAPVRVTQLAMMAGIPEAALTPAMEATGTEETRPAAASPHRSTTAELPKRVAAGMLAEAATGRELLTSGCPACLA
jgi:hypothetical protein